MTHRWATGQPRPPTISHTHRARILRRDQHTCYICRRPGATQVDHKIPRHLGGTDNDNNLAAIHAKPCHLNKTLAEAHAARTTPPRKRPPPPHPGVIR